ncbi:MAG: type II toxin-antitoxin system Phd/YefM family antitoxin [Acidimicrobiales bacterium]
MKTVGAYEAKTHLSRLLLEVERGQSITIPRLGQEVAKLVPVGRPATQTDQLVAALRIARSGARRGDDTVQSMIIEGRR